MSTLMGQLQARIETAVNKTGTYNEALQNLADAFGAPPSETGSRLIPVVKVFDPTIDNATAAQNYLLYNSTVVAGGIPAMALNFTSSESLDSRITFSRASNATVVNSDGLVSYAPHNLLTNSESFEAAAWIKSTGTITANATTAPDGTTTADKFINATTSNSTKHVSQTVGSTIGTFSVYAKAAEESVISLWLVGASVGAAFDLAAGTTVLQGATSSSITAVGNGWYRCTVYQNTATTTAHIYMRTGSAFVGNASDGVFLWGAQLNQGPLQPYYFTTPKNLLGYTQEFDNAAWSKSNITVTANSDAAPDGSQTADTLLGTAPGSANSCSQSITAAASVYTFSVWVKAKTATTCGILLRDETAATNLSVTAQIQSGPGSVSGTTVVSVSGLSTIQWTRVALTLNVPVTAGNTLRSILYPETATSANTTGKSNVFWGAQLSNSASLDPYVYNPGAAPTSSAYYGPRFDYDPVTLAPKGLLIEEQRTNLLTYSEQYDNAAWTKTTGTTVVANAATAPDGTTTADRVVYDGTGASGSFRIYQGNTISVLNQAYTCSVWMRADAPTTVRLYGNVVAGNHVTCNLTTTWQRFTTSGVGDGVAAAQLLIYSPASDNTAISFYIWGAQLEAGAFATSYIPTVASQVTRSADSASMIGDNFANWFNQGAGTIFAETIDCQYNSTTAAPILQIDNGVTTGNRYLLYFTGPTTSRFYTDPSAVGPTGTVSITGTTKVVGAYDGTNVAGAFNGVLGTQAAYTAPATQTQMRIGQLGAAANLNGHVRRIMYYNTRLTNAQLQTLTS